MNLPSPYSREPISVSRKKRMKIITHNIKKQTKFVPPAAFICLLGRGILLINYYAPFSGLGGAFLPQYPLLLLGGMPARLLSLSANPNKS